MKSKPLNKKYTDLCIYIDNTVYERDKNKNPIALREMSEEEQTNVYNYLCNIVIALAHKQNLFYSSQDYDYFTHIYAANLYMRLTDVNQNFNGSHPGRKKPVKSILNYIKGSMYFDAVNYRNQNFPQIISSERNSEERLETLKNYLDEDVQSQYRRQYSDIVSDYFSDIANYVRAAIDESIYAKSPYLRECLALSVELTILDLVSVSSCKKDVDSKKRCSLLARKIRVWREHIVSWNDEIPTAEIALCVQKTFQKMNSDIEKDADSDYVPEDVVKNILQSALPTYGVDQTEDT